MPERAGGVDGRNAPDHQIELCRFLADMGADIYGAVWIECGLRAAFNPHCRADIGGIASLCLKFIWQVPLDFLDRPHEIGLIPEANLEKQLAGPPIDA